MLQAIGSSSVYLWMEPQERHDQQFAAEPFWQPTDHQFDRTWFQQ